MDFVVGLFQRLPFWPSVKALGVSNGVSEEMLAALLIGLVIHAIAILLLPKGPRHPVALVSNHAHPAVFQR